MKSKVISKAHFSLTLFAEVENLKDAIKNKRDGKKSRFFTKNFKTLTCSIFTSFKVTTMIHGANRIYLFVEISWRALYWRARTCARAQYACSTMYSEKLPKVTFALYLGWRAARAEVRARQK